MRFETISGVEEPRRTLATTKRCVLMHSNERNDIDYHEENFVCRFGWAWRIKPNDPVVGGWNSHVWALELRRLVHEIRVLSSWNKTSHLNTRISLERRRNWFQCVLSSNTKTRKITSKQKTEKLLCSVSIGTLPMNFKHFLSQHEAMPSVLWI